MTLKIPPTNRELAQRFGVSTRTVRRATSGRRARDWWPALRSEVRQEAARLRATGMTWAEVGAALGMSPGAARAAGQRARGAWADAAPQQPDRDPNTGELFGS